MLACLLWMLLQVVLIVLSGQVELLGLADLRCHLVELEAVDLVALNHCTHLPFERFSGGFLLQTVIEDNGLVLLADVVALIAEGRGVVYFEEEFAELLVCQLAAIKSNLEHFKVSKLARFQLLVGGLTIKVRAIVSAHEANL